jgi:arylsulfatase A-like enzyme
VLDTTRADAISAYGAVAGTTPAVDALAAGGLRYTRAYAQAPWTLPSHATLFTGLLPSQHGVGWRHTWAPDALVTLAERLHEAGYETVGVSENVWVSAAFNMAQGFERFALTDEAARLVRAAKAVPDQLRDGRRDVRTTIADWARTRRPGRPFFLFVNVTDAHAPYALRATNPFLPPGVDAREARAVRQDPALYFCATDGHAHELAILRGLYLGGVAAADAKVRDVLATLRAAGLDRRLVTIVTADHGEHFGEQRLVSHQFSVREALLHVPLIVHGLPDTQPAVIETPVQLADVTPTILGWARLAVPEGLAGRPLPTRYEALADPRPLVSEFVDIGDQGAAEEAPLAGLLRRMTDALRHACGPEDRVFGDMRALVEDGFKLIWYAKYPPQLYDLGTDPGEHEDLAARDPSRVTAMLAELERSTGRPPSAADGEPPGAPAGEVLERLRALGYVGDPASGTPPAR